MASFANFQTAKVTTASKTVTSDSKSFVEGRMYFLHIHQQDLDEATELPAISGTGTWTPMQNQVYGSDFARLATWYWLCDGNATGTVTGTVSANTPNSLQLWIDEVTPGGGESFDGSSIVQSAKNGAGSGTTASVTLSAFADSGNISMAVFSNGFDQQVFTAGTDFTEIYSFEGNNHGHISQYRAQEDTNPDATVPSNSNWAAIGWELGFAAASAPKGIVVTRYHDIA